MSIFSFTEKEEVSLLINIGNGGINVSITSFKKNQVPKFLYSISAPFIGEKPDTSRLSDNMNLLLDSLLKITMKKGWNSTHWKNKDKQFSRVVISLSSPWLLLKSKDIHLAKETPFLITKNFIDNITLNEKKLFKKELIKNNHGIENEQYEIIEESIIHTKINGYSVDDIINKKTSNFDAYLYISAISQNIKEKISSVILNHTHIPKENIFIHSFPLILFSTIRDHFTETSDFVVLNINSEITDIILVSDHIIKSIASFPFGKNTIIRQIAKSFKVSLEIAESELNMYISKKIDGTMFNSIQSLIEDLEKEWSIYFEDALLNISPNMLFPKKIFMATDTKTASIFMDFLKSPKIDATSNFRKSLEIIHIDESTLSSFYQNSFKIHIDEPMIILTIFHNKLIQNQQSSF